MSYSSLVAVVIVLCNVATKWSILIQRIVKYNGKH